MRLTQLENPPKKRGVEGVFGIKNHDFFPPPNEKNIRLPKFLLTYRE